MQCSEEHLYKIATFNFDWKMVGKRLIGLQAIRDIDREEHSEQNKRDKMLEKWLEIDGSKATYRVLIEVLKDVQNTQAAEDVQKLASSIVIEGRRDVTLLVCLAYYIWNYLFTCIEIFFLKGNNNR